ncbi:MAG: hypothetical protein EPO08_09180 [Rhodospirillaceae bacterium]|nr:MAG: hypothetical protein EPO08_09180 [Rhodospirillaceae bacterium]
MTPKPKFMPEPRGWNKTQVAARLGISPSRFSELAIELLRAGFPQPDPITGKTDGDAVNAWMDSRSPVLASRSTANSDRLDAEIEAWAEGLKKLREES